MAISQQPADLDPAAMQQFVERELHARPRSRTAAGHVGVILELADGEAKFHMDRAQLGTRSRQESLETRMAGHVGSYVKVKVDDHWVVGIVRALRSARVQSGDHTGERLIGDIEFVGEMPLATDSQEFRRGVTRYPAPGDEVVAVSARDVAEVFSPRGRPHVTLGTVFPTEDVRAALFVDAMLGKHFAVLGSTGTGKSTATALLLHRLIDSAPHAHVIMLDPHGEYRAAFKDNAELFDVGNLELPYWLMTLEEHIEVIIGRRTPDTEVEVEILTRCLQVARAKSRLASEFGRVTADTPIPYSMAEVSAYLQAQMGKLEKPDKVAPFLKLKARIEEIRLDPRYSFMFSGLLVNDSFSDCLKRLLRMPGNGKPVSIIDLSGVPSEIVNVVVAVLARLLFDFALWTRTENRRPVLLVCEEAHRYVPAERLNASGVARKVLERIAKEGRKYGVALGLVTQRPSDLSESVLSQCGTVMALRMNNERDQAFVRSTIPEGARSILDALPSLRNRECFISGEGVPMPIRVRLDELEENLRPDSADPCFSASWLAPPQDSDFIDNTIHRWRQQNW